MAVLHVKTPSGVTKAYNLDNMGGIPVGFERFSMNPNIPQGWLPLLGGEYSRATYPDLWTWVQAQSGYCKTEAQWQELATSNNGNVPFYSSGDGSTTFRVPSLKCWIKGSNGDITEVGSYLEAGLPNITGGSNVGEFWVATPYHFTYDQGALKLEGNGGNNRLIPNTPEYYGYNDSKLSFDASHSNPIYGNSTTVQPESIVGLWLVKAYGIVEETGSINEQQYIDDRIAALPTSLSNTFLQLSGGTMTGDIKFYNDLYLGSPIDSDGKKSVYAGLYSNKTDPYKYGGISFINELTDGHPPQFNLSTGDGTHRHHFVGYGDEYAKLTWDGIPVLTTSGFTSVGDAGGYFAFKVNNGDSTVTPFIVQWGRIQRNGQTVGATYSDLIQSFHINFNTTNYALLMKSGWSGIERIVMGYRRKNEFTYSIENAAANPHDVTWLAVGW